MWSGAETTDVYFADRFFAFQGRFIGLCTTELRDGIASLTKSLIKSIGGAMTFCVTVYLSHSSQPSMLSLHLNQGRCLHNLCGRKATISSY